MSIYFAREDKNGWIKIGTSTNPKNRIQNMRSGIGPSIGKVKLLKVADGSYEEERFYHSLLCKYHVDFTIGAGREWFEPSDDVMFFANMSSEQLNELHKNWREVKDEHGDKVKFVFNGKNVIAKSRQ